MSEHNKQLVRRFYEEVENGHNLAVVDELFAPEFRDVYNSASPFAVAGIEGVKKLAVGLHEALDLSIRIEDLIAEGDRVVARIACGITNKTPFLGHPPTGRRFTVQGVEIFRVVAGKLLEREVFIDMMPVMLELGIVKK
jgi:predicted ester cyclase